MIGIKVNNTFLDISAGATTQFDQNSPLFSFDQIEGEYSLPVTLPASERNLQALGFINELQVKKSSASINDAQYFEDGVPIYKGTLVCEYYDGNLNIAGGVISAYFLIGVSNFYQQIKSKKMKDLQLGGGRVFNWAGFDRNAAGFWKQAHDTWNGQDDYVFAPIVNENWENSDGSGSVDFMNKLAIVDNSVQLSQTENYTNLVAMPYLAYVFKQLFIENGFNVEGDIFDDPDFNRLMMPNFQAVDWGTLKQEVEAGWNPINHPRGAPVPYVYTFYPHDQITIDLSQHMPDCSQSEFFLAIRNRFGLGITFNNRLNKVTIRQLNKVWQQSERKDFTGKVSAKIKNNFAKQEIYALKQDFDTNDSAVSAPDFNSVNLKGNVNIVKDLPGNAKQNDCYFVLYANQYYVYNYNSDTYRYDWVAFSDNIYDYEPDGNTQSITTSATPLGMRYVKLFEVGGADFYFHCASCEQEGNWKGKQGDYINWGIRLMFYHQLFNKYASGILLQIPLVTNSCYQYDGNHPGNWSLSYVQGQRGLIKTFWQQWINILQSQEQPDFTFLLSLADMTKLQWHDIILVAGVAYLVMKRQPVSPFNGQLYANCIRMQYGQITPCPAITLNAPVINNNSVTISWESDGGSFDIYLDNNFQANTANKQYSLYNIAAGDHTIKVSAACSTGDANSDSKDFSIAQAPPSIVKISSTAINNNTERQELFQVGPSIAAGNKFTLMVYSHEVTVTADAGDTPDDIIVKLMNAVNATTEAQWDDHNSAPNHGTAGFPPTAIIVRPNLRVTLNWQNSFACSASVD